MLAVFSGQFHVFFILTYTSFVCFAFFFVLWCIQGKGLKQHFAYPWKIVLFAVAGIGGYRLVYFLAFDNGPAVEVNLLNYLWPIFMVLFTGALPGERLRSFHVLGSLVGFCGLYFLLRSKVSYLEFDWGAGHVFGFLAAVMWGAFSVLSRRVRGYSSHVVPASFMWSTILFSFIYFIFYFNADQFKSLACSDWLYLTALGIFAGVGYFLWDIGMKYGNIQFLAVSSYFTPLLSTLILFLAGQGVLSQGVVLAAILIFLGSVIASSDKLHAFYKSFNADNKIK